MYPKVLPPGPLKYFSVRIASMDHKGIGYSISLTVSSVFTRKLSERLPTILITGGILVSWFLMCQVELQRVGWGVHTIKLLKNSKFTFRVFDTKGRSK